MPAAYVITVCLRALFISVLFIIIIIIIIIILIFKYCIPRSIVWIIASFVFYVIFST